MPRSRSASPKRPLKTTAQQGQEKPFPWLSDYILEEFGKQYSRCTKWNDWQSEAEEFMEEFCEDLWRKGTFTRASLAFFFAYTSYDRHYGSKELQLIVNPFCDRIATTGGQGQLFLNEVANLYSSMKESYRPGAYKWCLLWSRLVRHMNQGIPLAIFIPDGRVFPCYNSVITEADCHNRYVIPESLSYEKLNPAILAFHLHDQVTGPFGKRTVTRHASDRTKLHMFEDIILRNFAALVGGGFTLSTDHFGGLEPGSALSTLRELLSEDPNFKVEEVKAIRISVAKAAAE